jgi:hypothetical protein
MVHQIFSPRFRRPRRGHLPCITADSNPQPSDPKNGISPIVVAVRLGHSLAICRPAYAHLARFARYVCIILGPQDETDRVMEDILTPPDQTQIPID